MAISKDFNSVFSKDWEINFMQCMPNGLLKYTELCNFFQLTAAEHSESGGISFSDMQMFNQAWVLSKMRIEINELPKWKDTVTVKTWINTIENSRSIRALEMYLNGKKIIGCESFWVVFNTKTRRPEALSLPFDHFELFPENKATEKSFFKIKTNDCVDLVSEKKVVLSDLDLVNHVNHVKYLEWCLDLMDSDLLMNIKTESLEMSFFKELSLNDLVSISNNTESTSYQFNVLKDNSSCFALRIIFKY